MRTARHAQSSREPARTHTDLTKEECDDAGRDPDVGSRHAQEALEALGPISQRARLGTVREDYSAYGSAWEYLPPGANHQTGWTGLVIKLMQQSGERARRKDLSLQLAA